VISREEARVLAARWRAEQDPPQASGTTALLTDVQDGDHWNSALSKPAAYGFPGLAGNWIIYVTVDPVVALKSSEIIVVSKSTGAILFAGDAGDEG
jgi:hypothetical protein